MIRSIIFKQFYNRNCRLFKYYGGWIINTDTAGTVFFAYQTENNTTEITLSYCAAIQSILDFVLRGFENPFSFIPPFQTVVCVKWQMVVLCARYKKFFVMENLCKQFIVLYWQSFLILTLLLWLLILLALFCCCHLNRNWLPKWSLAYFMVYIGVQCTPYYG